MRRAAERKEQHRHETVVVVERTVRGGQAFGFFLDDPAARRVIEEVARAFAIEGEAKRALVAFTLFAIAGEALDAIDMRESGKRAHGEPDLPDRVLALFVREHSGREKHKWITGVGDPVARTELEDRCVIRSGFDL